MNNNKKTKLVILGDPHWGARNNSPVFIEYFREFYSNQFLPYLRDHKDSIAGLIILGDVYDHRLHSNHKVIKASREIFFDPLDEIGIQSYVLVGNHDTTFRSTLSVNSIDLLLSHYKNLSIISAPQTRMISGESIALLPWICSDNVDDSMEMISETNAQILFGHLELSGFEFHRGQLSHDGLSPELFKKFEYVFSGHYHHKSTRGNISYLGTPYELNWHDYDDPRGFHVFDLESRSLAFIENPNKMFIRLEYDDSDERTHEKFLKSLQENQSLKDKTIKLVVVNKTNYYLFDQFIQELYQKGCNDIKILENLSDMIISSENNETLDSEIDLEDTQSILMNYIDRISLDGENRESLKTFIKTLYLEALNEEPV